MTIRRAVATDLTALTELHHEFCDADGHRFEQARAWAGFTPLLADDRHGMVLIAHVPETAPDPSGYAVLTWGWSIEAGGPEAILDELYVRERNAGHGAALLTEAIAQAAEHGMTRIFLETELRNERARAFYLRAGFDVDDSVWMSLDLNTAD